MSGTTIRSPRLWKIPEFITPAYQQSLLTSVRQAVHTLRAEKDMSISKNNSFLFHFASFFNKDYNNSKRTMLLSHDIDRCTPEIKRLYFHDMPIPLSALVKTPLFPVDNNGTLALQVFVYDKPGDRIDPHLDHCYFLENQKVITALLCLENRSAQKLCIDSNAEILPSRITQPLDGLNPQRAADALVPIPIEAFQQVENPLKCIDMNDRDLLVFEHDVLRHAIRPEIVANESRIVIGMVFAEYPYASTIQQYVWEKFKNVSHYPLHKALLPADRLVLVILVILFIFVILVVFVILHRRRRHPHHHRLKKN